MEALDIAKNIELFKSSQGWKLMVEEIDKKIKEYTDFITGDLLPETVDGEMNERKFDKFDLLRVERNVYKQIKELPDMLIRSHNPITIGKPQA